MGQTEFERFAQRLTEDYGLRAEFRRDPVGVAERAGLSLSDNDKDLLRAKNWQDMSDEELLERASTSAWIKPA
jgi:hypothetical protein